MSVCSFSQNFSKPRIIKDSIGVTLYAFDENQINYIIKKLKEENLNNRLVNEMQKEINLLKLDNNTYKNLSDSLNTQIKTYTEIKINYDGQIQVYKKEIDILNKNIEDYKEIDNNFKEEIVDLKLKLKKKNGWIVKLVATNIITATLLILFILK